MGKKPDVTVGGKKRKVSGLYRMGNQGKKKEPEDGSVLLILESSRKHGKKKINKKESTEQTKREDGNSTQILKDEKENQKKTQVPSGLGSRGGARPRDSRSGTILFNQKMVLQDNALAQSLAKISLRKTMGENSGSCQDLQKITSIPLTSLLTGSWELRWVQIYEWVRGRPRRGKGGKKNKRRRENRARTWGPRYWRVTGRRRWGRWSAKKTFANFLRQRRKPSEKDIKDPERVTMDVEDDENTKPAQNRPRFK